MFEYTSKRCRKCLLQEDPSRGLLLDETGLCPLCRSYQPVERDWDALETRFNERVNALKKGKKYDAVLMMSGGKDSAYLAYLLTQKMKLNILGVTIDNGFEYPETFEKAELLAKEMNIDHELLHLPAHDSSRFYRFLISTPGLMEKDFGQICLYCGRYLLESGCSFAEQHKIPALFVGYNPEQLFGMGKTLEIETDALRRQQQKAIAGRITYLFTKMEHEAKKHQDRSLIPHFREDIQTDVICPFLYLPYRPQEIMETALQKTRWEPISSFASEHYIASGCKLLKLMAALAKINHVSSYMDYEFSAQVRAGELDPHELKKYYSALEEPEEFYQSVLQQLGLDSSLETLAQLPFQRSTP